MKVSVNKVWLDSFAELQKFSTFVVERCAACDLSADDQALLASPEARLILGLYATGSSDIGKIQSYAASRYFFEACLTDRFLGDVHLVSWLAQNDQKMSAALARICQHPPEVSRSSFDHVQEAIALLNLDNTTLALSQKYYDRAQGEIQRDGYCVIPDLFDADYCAEVRKNILAIAQREESAGKSYRYGIENRFQRIYNIITKGQEFSDFLSHPIVKIIMDDMFERPTLHDKYYVTSWHANIIPPNGESQKLHVDAAVPEPLPPWIVRANINFILEDYWEHNGATLCVPGSHLWHRKPGPDDQQLIARSVKPIEAKAGSIAVWHGHLWHQSGHNRSSNPRVALLAGFASSFLMEMVLEENHFRVMSEEFAATLSPDLYRLFGWHHGIKAGAKLGAGAL